MSSPLAIFRLLRADTSILVFLSAFVPLLARSGQLLDSLRKALPLLFIGACTFIANDLDDIESDKINHPERPLPSGEIYATTAVALYFCCLALALVTTKSFASSNVAPLYYTLLVLVISYGYVEEFYPNAKCLYVATTSTLPLLIAAGAVSDRTEMYLASTSAFFLVLSRELCMDFCDRAGDKKSFIHTLSRRKLTVLAQASQAAAIVFVFLLTDSTLDAVALVALIVLSVLSFSFWVRVEAPTKAILAMKIQFFVGLYFLAF